MSEERLISWLRLTRLKGVGPILVKRLLEALGSATAILEAHPSRLASIDGIGTVKANQVAGSAAETEAPAREEFARAMQLGLTLLTLNDDRYPPALKTIHDPPLVLYVRGELLPADTLAVGMVGARKCTLYGREQAQRLAGQLAQHGMTVISGGARGIDTAAHVGALNVKGRTLVIQGCGLMHTYPPENAPLYDRIVAEKAGAIISELTLDAPPSKENFPPRNRIIAGMSLGIVVVEANLQSGSLITARLAAADYGREVFALPGRVDSPASAGTHHLIKTASAHLVECAEDILGHLGDVGRALQQISPEPSANPETPSPGIAIPGLSSSTGATPLFPSTVPATAMLTTLQQKILAAIGREIVTIDTIVETTALPPQVIVAELTLLQIRGLITRLPANRFACKN